jgi:hypothetical protein
MTLADFGANVIRVDKLLEGNMDILCCILRDHSITTNHMQLPISQIFYFYFLFY